MTERNGTTLMHWGAFEVESQGNRVTNVTGVAGDPDPSPIGQQLLRSQENRVREPHVRASWLSGGVFANPEARGDDEMVAVDWNTAIDLAAEALRTIRDERGNEAIYAGSYGWASAGRFHHANSQLKRFLNTIGGFTASQGTYSHAAAEVVVPTVLGLDFKEFTKNLPSIDEIGEHTEVLISFGGFPASNTEITSGGDVEHWYRPEMRALVESGCRLISLSPVRTDFDAELGVQWIPIRPGTDSALMLALASAAVGRVPRHDFLETHCSGAPEALANLTQYTVEWASKVCGIDEATIGELSDLIIERRTMVNATWSTQRVAAGETSIWALILLGSVMGTIGTPGEGIIYGLGSMGTVGSARVPEAIATLPQGTNPIGDPIPCTRIADALENPGEPYWFVGEERTFPDIDLIYWSGGNPFHHHQDLNRLDQLWRRPRAVIVNDPFWTATAQRADIVFPATTGLERSDFGGAPTAGHLVHMQQVLDPVGSSKNDYDIFTMLAERFGTEAAFTEGRTADEWIAALYETTRQSEARLPESREEPVVLRPASEARRPFHAFLDDPVGFPLATPSGKIELTMSNLGLADGPTWTEPKEWSFPGLDLITPMPTDKLHSQYNHADVGPPILYLTVVDADARGLACGDRVELRNDRGRCHGVVEITEDIMVGVASMANGAMLRLRKSESGLVCEGGNVNVLTSDEPSSNWAQATTAHTCRVEVRRVGAAG